MITFRGTYFDGVSSRAQAVTVVCLGHGLSLRSDDRTLRVEVAWRDLSLAPALGQSPRVLTLPGGARCETSDLAAVSELERQWRAPRGWIMRQVHRLESYWRWAIVCVACLALSLWGAVSWGIPWMATQAALATPPKLVESISARSLAFLDRELFQPSRLPQSRQSELQWGFQKLVHDVGANDQAQLLFRHSPSMGANALALPSGAILVTDELVNLAHNDRELVGILAHELAHIEERHSLRNMYQSTGLVWLLSMLTGDVAAMTSTASSLPTFLIETGYSRQFETAADTFAGRYLIAQGWGTQPLRDILQRLATDQRRGLPSFLSTHPGATERLRHLATLERTLSPPSPSTQ